MFYNRKIMQKSRILLFEKAKSAQKITAGLLLIHK